MMLEAWSQVIERYYRLLSAALHRQSLVPEFLDTDLDGQAFPRLLCQTRGLIFLLKYSQIHSSNEAHQLSRRLYTEIRQHYLQADPLGHKPLLSQHGAALYELAFLLNAQTQLALSDRQTRQTIPGLLDDREQTLQSILNIAFLLWLQPRENGDFFELNALMHLFEALTLSQGFEPDDRIEKMLLRLGNLLAETFWQPHLQLLAERITRDQTVLEYDLGHNFEWCSLIALNQSVLADHFPIDPKVLLVGAQRATQQQFEAIISHRLDPQTFPIAEDARIWVNLERLRCLAIMNDPDMLTVETQVFKAFLAQGLPQEYLTRQSFVKSTTGYHLIECYCSLLQWEQLRSSRYALSDKA